MVSDTSSCLENSTLSLIREVSKLALLLSTGDVRNWWSSEGSTDSRRLILAGARGCDAASGLLLSAREGMGMAPGGWWW